MGQTKSFIDALFDSSFTSLITSKIIKLMYGLSIAGAGILTLSLILFGFGLSEGAGVFMLLVGGPLVFLLTVIYVRVTLEIVIVVFRISEHAGEIAEQGRKISSRME